MTKVYRRSCGMDVHKDTIVVCVLPAAGEDGKAVRKTYGTFRNDLIRMRVWLPALSSRPRNPCAPRPPLTRGLPSARPRPSSSGANPGERAHRYPSAPSQVFQYDIADANETSSLNHDCARHGSALPVTPDRPAAAGARRRFRFRRTRRQRSRWWTGCASHSTHGRTEGGVPGEDRRTRIHR